MKEFLSMSKLVNYLEEHKSLIGSTKSGSEYMVNLSQYNWQVAKITLHDDKPLR